jgi:hypothetical protein
MEYTVWLNLWQHSSRTKCMGMNSERNWVGYMLKFLYSLCMVWHTLYLHSTSVHSSLSKAKCNGSHYSSSLNLLCINNTRQVVGHILHSTSHHKGTRSIIEQQKSFNCLYTTVKPVTTYQAYGNLTVHKAFYYILHPMNMAVENSMIRGQFNK